MQPPANRETALRTMQIIAGALIAGVAAAIIVVLLTIDGEPEPSSLLGNVAGAVSILALVVCAIVPASMGAQWQFGSGVSEAESRELAYYAAYQTRMIIRFALLEGAAFFNIVAAAFDRQPYSLLIAAVLAGIMLAMFPTRSRVEKFVKSQTELEDLPRRPDGT